MTDVTILTGDLTGSYQVIGAIEVQVRAMTLFSRDRTIAEVDAKLRAEAVRRGANAVINVKYDRGVSASSWKALTALGIAVVASPDAQPAAWQPPPDPPAGANWGAAQDTRPPAPPGANWGRPFSG